ncbi:hypothetical protein RB595_003609 [Gaeumannomyces hyphopodioides]
MAARTQLSTLPAELRSEIWRIALLPSPGVYRCDTSKFIHTCANRRSPYEVEDARWLIPKRRYPTVMHLCHESRLFALGVMEKEARENSFLYCIGQDTRPFIPEIDTFWFDDNDDGGVLHDATVYHERGAIGSRVHTIRNLAVSAAIVQSCREAGVVSNWDSYTFFGIGRFVNLRRVDVVFGPVPMETRCDDYKTDRDCWAATAQEQVLGQHNDSVVLSGMYDVPELWLVKEVRGSGVETTGSSADEDQDRNPGVVKEKLDKIRGDVYKSLKGRAKCKYTAPGRELQQQHLAGAAHRGGYVSEITFHASRMVETARFRKRTIRKSFPSWFFD